MHDLSWERFENTRILITGVTGLLGINIAAAFVSARQMGLFRGELVGVSRSGEIPSSWRVLLDEVVPWSIGDAKAPLDRTFDVIFHAAGYGQPARFMAEPLATMRMNSIGTLDVLELLKPGGRFVNFSSSEVYWGISGDEANEDRVGVSGPDHPRAMYIEAKRFSETVINIATQTGRGAGLNLRVSLVYGPGAKWDDSRVMSDFIRSGLVNRRIELRDSGTAVRNYLFVDDAVKLIVRLTVDNFSGTVNLGGESKTTILELAELVADETESVVVVPSIASQSVAGAPTSVSVSLERLQSLTKLADRVSLPEGVSRTIEWFEYLSLLRVKG